jgi:hypothetical protein
MDRDLWITPTEGSATLEYRTDAQKNRIPDFSLAGYRGGLALPRVPVRVTVTPVEGDNTARIQAAIDYVSGLKADEHGLRGAVLLRKGRYQVAGALTVSSSGVVVRGEGSDENGTVLVATGPDRRALVSLRGKHDPVRLSAPLALAPERVPVGAVDVTLRSVEGLKKGQTVLIERPSTKEWIQAVGMHEAPGPTVYYWRPGTVDLAWERVIRNIKGRQVQLDAPLTTALEPAFGGATLCVFDQPGRIENAGVENLRLVSAYDPANARDENHSWIAVQVAAARDSWVDGVTGLHFAGSLVDVSSDSKNIAVRDCSSLQPVSELGGYRRHTYMIGGQLSLVLRCRAEDGRNDFTAGYQTSGPLVFLECEALRSTGRSGPVGSWCSGLLYDNVKVDAGALALDNLEIENQGAGWAAANSVLWQCSASLIVCRRPPTANNWAIGVWGEFRGDGVWQQANEYVEPGSLYRAQLAARLGRGALKALEPTSFETAAGRAPSLEAAVPDLALRCAPKAELPGLPLKRVNGWLVVGDRLLIGRQIAVSWWRGQLAPARSASEGPSLTRFVPGREGPGLTDNLEDLANGMLEKGQGALRHHYGLWYDRRRDDHVRVRRVDAETWPPFYEQPFARSGQGSAWDRLSRYDLTKYNAWYFMRLERFAALARERGLALINEMYFQHNILENGAHWVDCPWRPSNCLQATEISDPTAQDDGKRIFLAEAFYDSTHPLRRELHRAYMRHCLEALSSQPNVIHTLSEEYTGPLSFMRFWLDTVAEWKNETHLSPLIALSATKDVQDEILADRQRSAAVDVIDLKYWWRSRKGLFAPDGAKNMAPRQSERLWKGGRPRASDIASMVWDYRSRFQDKAVICPFEEADGWASLAAGASLPPLPRSTEVEILRAVPSMKVLGTEVASGAQCWVLDDPGRCMFAYLPSGGEARVMLPANSRRARLRSIDLATGGLSEPGTLCPAENQLIDLSSEKGKPAAFWIDFPAAKPPETPAQPPAP